MKPDWVTTPPIKAGIYWYYGTVYHGESPRYRQVRVCITAEGNPTFFVQESILYAEDFNRMGVQGIWTPMVYPDLPDEYKP
jgi:hypothetical protein